MDSNNKNKNDNIVNFAAFFALAIIALLIVIENFFPVIGINITGTFVNVLRTLQSVLMLLTLGISGYNFVRGKKKGWKIAYLVIIVIFIAAVVLIWVNNK